MVAFLGGFDAFFSTHTLLFKSLLVSFLFCLHFVSSCFFLKHQKKIPAGKKRNKNYHSKSPLTTVDRAFITDEYFCALKPGGRSVDGFVFIVR